MAKNYKQDQELDEIEEQIYQEELVLINTEFQRIMGTAQQLIPTNYEEYWISRYYDVPFDTQRCIQDLRKPNKSGCNFFHRACFRRDHIAIEKVIKDLYSQSEDEEKMKKEIMQMINFQDFNGLTPLFHVFFSPCLNEKDTQDQYLTVRMLINLGASYKEIKSKIQEWGITHWITFSECEMVLKSLREDGLDVVQFDKKGIMPVDIAGKKKNESLTKFLIKSYLEDFDSVDELKPREELELRDRLIISKLAAYKNLYWAAYFGLKEEFMEIAQRKDLLMDYPLKNLERRTIFHACCFKNSHQILQFAFNYFEDIQRSIFAGQKRKSDFSLLIDITNKEKKFFGEKLLKMINNYKKWVKKYFKTTKRDWLVVPKNNTTYDNLVLLNGWERQDIYGNTLVHYASVHNSVECLKLCFKKNCNFNCSNKSDWKPPELVNTIEIKTEYLKFFKLLGQTAHSSSSRFFSNKWFLKKNNLIKRHKWWKSGPKKLYEFSGSILRSQLKRTSNQLMINSDKLAFPNLCFKIEIRGLSEESKLAKMDRIDYLISILSNHGYLVSLFTGSYNSNYYLTVTAGLEKLQSVMEEQKMKIKVSFLPLKERYVKENPIWYYEPITSNLKQEIILADLKKIIDFQELLTNSLIIDYVWVSNLSAVNRIKSQLLSDKLLAIPYGQFFSTILTFEKDNLLDLRGVEQYYGIYSSLKLYFIKFMFYVFGFNAIIAAAIQIYLEITKSIVSNVSFVWFIILWFWIAWLQKLWTRKEWSICSKLGYLKMKKVAMKNKFKQRSDIVFIGEKVNLKFLQIERAYKKNGSFGSILTFIALTGLIFAAMIGGMIGIDYIMQELLKRFSNFSVKAVDATKGFISGAFVILLQFLWQICFDSEFEDISFELKTTKEKFGMLTQYFCRLFIGYFYPFYLYTVKQYYFGGYTQLKSAKIKIESEVKFFMIGYLFILQVLKPLFPTLFLYKSPTSQKKEMFERLRKLGKNQSLGKKMSFHDDYRRAFIQLKPKGYEIAEKLIPLANFVEIDFYRKNYNILNETLISVGIDLSVAMSCICVLPCSLLFFLFSVILNRYNCIRQLINESRFLPDLKSYSILHFVKAVKLGILLSLVKLSFN